MNKVTLENVLEIINKWSKDNDVLFHGGFVSFDKKGEVKEDTMVCYGDKKTLKISLDEFNKAFEAEKDEFVNW